MEPKIVDLPKSYCLMTLLLAKRHILALDDRQNLTILIGRQSNVGVQRYLNTLPVYSVNLPNHGYFSCSIIKESPLDV